ncbi:haloacid dehalogenase-like hydrolase, partial [Microvirga sp. 3-52]|nr:haloacid dehalogenase-like hydrolase [Microvirga sp. 3-52]
MDALKDLSVEEMDTYFREVATKMKADFNPDVVTKVKQHAADGVHVMLVSGAYTPLLHIAVDGLPFDKIIGTNIPIKNSVIDLKTPILHVQGTEKNEQIETALANQKIDWDNSFAYADSYS